MSKFTMNLSCYKLLAVLFLFGIGQSGCSQSDQLNRVIVQGRVNFAGAPVPFGSIWFEPDQSVGTQAPTGFATIRKGVFKTSLKDSPISGQYTLKLSGYSKDISELQEENDSKDAKVLFSDFAIKKEISVTDHEWTLNVPN